MAKSLEKRLRLKEDLKLVVPAAIFGAIFGGVCSLIEPLAIPTALKDITKKETWSVAPRSTFAVYAAGIGVYGFAIYEYAKTIVENPTNPFTYIPIATNLVSQMYFEYEEMEELVNRKH